MVFCFKCGEKIKDSEICPNCQSAVIKEEYFNISKIESINELFTSNNKKHLQNHELSIDAYNIIIENIRTIGKTNLRKIHSDIGKEEYENLDILSKIAIITLAYTDINYKSKGAELGSYTYNLVNIDDRLDNANQISTLIHELSHHLYAEIFEQVLMYIWEVEKTGAIESLVLISQSLAPQFRLSNEYCAHTCEGRFIPHGYQNYSSFNEIINEEFSQEKKEDTDIIKTSIIFGNTIAEDIINILEEFITPELRQEIKLQYKKDMAKPNYDQILFETDNIFPDEVKISLILMQLECGYEATSQRESDELLNEFEEQFRC